MLRAWIQRWRARRGRRLAAEAAEGGAVVEGAAAATSSALQAVMLGNLRRARGSEFGLMFARKKSFRSIRVEEFADGGPGNGCARLGARRRLLSPRRCDGFYDCVCVASRAACVGVDRGSGSDRESTPPRGFHRPPRENGRAKYVSAPLAPSTRLPLLIAQRLQWIAPVHEADAATPP
jgi:hypothetical protein